MLWRDFARMMARINHTRFCALSFVPLAECVMVPDKVMPSALYWRVAPAMQDVMNNVYAAGILEKLRAEAKAVRSGLSRNHTLDPTLVRDWATSSDNPFADKVLRDTFGTSAPIDSDLSKAFDVHVFQSLGVMWRVPVLRASVDRKSSLFQREHTRFLRKFRPGILDID